MVYRRMPALGKISVRTPQCLGPNKASRLYFARRRIVSLKMLPETLYIFFPLGDIMNWGEIMLKEKGTILSKSFEPEELMVASSLRKISQRDLQKALNKHGKIGVLFPKEGLSVVMIQFQHFKTLLDRVEELEDTLEEIELQRLYGDRVELPRDQWLTKPEGMAVAEFYENFKVTPSSE